MRKALIVGIDDYPTSPLHGCVNDANAIAAILEKNGDGSHNFDVKKRLNVRTKGELKRMVTELFSGDPDASLLYFSGHGHNEKVGGYLVTLDCTDYDYGVSMDEILTIANKSRAKNRIIILDCCYSGAFGSPHCTGGEGAQICEGVTILAASKDDEASLEENGHGIFTTLLLAALRGGAADIGGHITSGSVYAYIDRSLGAWDQRPVFKTNISSFFSLRAVEPTVPPETLRKLTQYFSKTDMLLPLDPSFEDTNDPTVEHKCIEPYADIEHVAILKDLQKLVSVGLVEPVGAKHMYFAAMESKACKLTPLGRHYWRLVEQKRY